MTSISSLVEDYKDLMETSLTTGPEADFYVAYNQKTLPNPLTKMYVVLNPEKVESVKYTENPQVYTYTMTIKLGLEIHVGERKNAAHCLRMFSSIVSLFESVNNYRLTESGCGSLKRNSNTNSIYLPCYLCFTVYY